MSVTAKYRRHYPRPGLKNVTTPLVLIGLLYVSLMISSANAQRSDPAPSVMDRIQEKVRQRNLNWFERLDPRGTGYATWQSVENSIRERFALLDTNRDGAIDRNEYLARKLPSPSFVLPFGLLDADVNGLLSAAEFSAPIIWRFSRLDIDGDGRISREEAARYLATPTARALPQLNGTCFELNGRVTIVAPQNVERFEREGRRSIDCAWKPGSSTAR